MPQVWDFIKEHLDIEKRHEKDEKELQKRKKEILTTLVGKKVKLTLQYTPASLEGYTEEVSGTVYRVGVSFVALKSPQPPAGKHRDTEEHISLKDIRAIEG